MDVSVTHFFRPRALFSVPTELCHGPQWSRLNAIPSSSSSKALLVHSACPTLSQGAGQFQVLSLHYAGVEETQGEPLRSYAHLALITANHCPAHATQAVAWCLQSLRLSGNPGNDSACSGMPHTHLNLLDLCSHLALKVGVAAGGPTTHPPQYMFSCLLAKVSSHF